MDEKEEGTMRYANEIANEIEKRGPVTIPEGCMTGEEFDMWLYGNEDDYAVGKNVWHQYEIIEVNDDLFQYAIEFGEAA
jgi:hypothetical protein